MAYKILLISPCEFPVNSGGKYGGIERLVWEYSRELVKNHKVTVQCTENSNLPEGVEKFSARSEYRGYIEYQGLLRKFDVVHDFSHLHLASRNNKLPSVNLFWHSPAVAHYPKSPYNIIAPSKWALREFKRVYRQEAVYQQIILIDPGKYKPVSKRGDRYLTLGKMSPDKGNLEVVRICQELKLPLDVVGGRGAYKENEPLDAYELGIREACTGDIKFLGEVSEEDKVKLMQTCKALVYYSSSPEITAHKVQEALMCGCPVIVPATGSMNEWVEEGVNGFLCRSHAEYIQAMVGKLPPEYMEIHLKAKELYSPENVIAKTVEIYDRVVGGERW